MTDSPDPRILSLSLDPALADRLTALAQRLDQDLDGVLVQALEEFADRWEDHLRDVDALDAGAEERVMLQVVND